MGSRRSRELLVPVLLAGVLLAAAMPAFAGGAPRVVKTSPGNGAADVDPSLTEIRVEFDQDMLTSSFSFVGGGPSFPVTMGQPSWVDRRTCVLPVRLEPGREYVFSINSERHQGFRGVDGTPAALLVVKFRTSDVPAERKSDAAGPDAATAKLRELVREQYSYRDRLGLNWDSLFEAHRVPLEAARTPRAFAEEAANLLRDAIDVHIWLDVDGVRLPTFQRQIPLNFDLAGIRKAVPGLKHVAPAVYSGQFPDGTGYLLLGSLDRDRAPVNKVVRVLERFQNAPSLILDLRANGGGDERLAQEIAGCFVDRPVRYGTHAVRVNGRVEEIGVSTLSPAETGRPHLHGKVAVLQGRFTMSSAEALVLMMRHVPGCISVGDTTYGSSGNPKPYDLGNGVTVYLPSWRAMDDSNREFEGKGLAPDLLVEAEPDAFRSGDPIIEKAKELLTTR